MKKPIWIKYILLALVVAMVLSLFACNDGSGQNETENNCSEPSESETAVDSEDTEESENESESETEIDLDSITYENGAEIDGAGNLLDDEAFALVERSYDRSIAVEKSAEEIKAMLADKTMTEGAVYLVKEAIVLDSNTIYYGNLATVIAEGGIIIKNTQEVLIKELIVEGNVTVENSTDAIIFRLYMVSDGVAINVSEDSYNISVKSCRINATDTALVMNADLSTVYQNYFLADKGIVSMGDDMAAQSNVIIAKTLGISATGAYCTVKNNTVEAASDGVAVKLANVENGLVALNDLTGAQMSVVIEDAFNSSVILNRAIRIEGSGSKNLYVVDNKLGGAIELQNNNYLICDGNSFPDDGHPHPVSNKDNRNYNGDNMHDVNARLEVGADEDLLPHTNKDLFISMERRSQVRDISLPKSYTFNAYVRNVAKNNSIVIVPPGVYSVNSTLNIQASHSNTTVYAYGVYQEAMNYIQSIDITSASNISIKGLTVGYSQQSAGQIQVLDKLKNNQLLVISSAGFTEEFGKLNTKKFGTGGYFFHPGEYTSWTELGSWGAYEIIPNKDGTLINSDGTFTIQLTGKNATKYFSIIEKGEIFTCRLEQNASGNGRTIGITSSKNVLFKDTVTYGYAEALVITMHGAGTTGVKLERHHNLAHSAYEIEKETYDKYKALEEQYGVDLEVYIDEQGRYRGSDPRIGSLDAAHVGGSEQGLSATSSLFENAADDASNQRGYSSRLHDVIDNGDGTLTLLYKDYLPETYLSTNMRNGATDIQPGYQVYPFVKGDRIFIYASNGKVFCDTTVLSNTVEYQTKVVIYETDYDYNGQTRHLTWRSTINAVTVRKSDVDMSALEGYDLSICTPDMTNKVIVDNLSRNSVGFTFDNCMVRHNRGRVVIKTRDAVITNCTFKDMSYAGIVMSVESTWGESSVPCNITVTKSLFDGTSQTFQYENNTKYAAIAVEGLGSSGASTAATLSESSIPCHNITITDNVFRNVSNNYYVTVAAAKNVTIANNTFETRNTESEKRVGKAIYVNSCMNVNISGNTYSKFANGDVTKVITANNYLGLTGSDVEGVFAKDKLQENEVTAD